MTLASFHKLCLLALPAVAVLGFIQEDGPDYSLEPLNPAGFDRSEAQVCLNCKQDQNNIMNRSIGALISDGRLVADSGGGWLNSAHANSLNHEDEFNSRCVWCHAPTSRVASQGKDDVRIIESPKELPGITCSACHPGQVPREQRPSTLANYHAGQDPADPASFVFIDKSAGANFNRQCAFCHEGWHELLPEAKKQMLADGDLRCIDCHMAGYRRDPSTRRNTVERFHNMKVEANIPWSCSGAFGALIDCHPDADEQWMRDKVREVYAEGEEWEISWW